MDLLCILVKRLSISSKVAIYPTKRHDFTRAKIFNFYRMTWIVLANARMWL